MGGVSNATSLDFTPEFTTFMKAHPMVAAQVYPVHPLEPLRVNGPLLTREKEAFTQVCL